MKKVMKYFSCVLILSIVLCTVSFSAFTAENNETYVTTEDDVLKILSSLSVKEQPMYGREEISEKPVNEHPRLMFRKDDIQTIKANLSAEENADISAEFEKYADMSLDNNAMLNIKLDTFNYNTSSNLLNIIEAKAFDYIINNNENNGIIAKSGIRNLMATINYDLLNKRGNNYHDVSHILMIAAEVYDWCYPLYSDDDKTDLIKSAQRLMGYFEWGRSSTLTSCWNQDTQLSYPLNLETISMVSGAASSSLLLIDMFSFAASTYDIQPDLYNYVSAIIVQRCMPARNYWNDSGRYMSGSSYGALRAFSDSWLYWMTDKALGSSFHDDDIKKLAYYILYEYMPDGKNLREGDDNWHAFTHNSSTDYDDTTRYAILQLLGSATQNPYYKAMAKRINDNYAPVLTNYGYCPFTAVQQLIINDPSLEPADLSEIPYTRYFGKPDGTMIARTGWDIGKTASTAAAFMKIGGQKLYDHVHADAGSFQIYYKGILIQDLGMYARTDKAQYYAYNTSTVSHNSMLIYDPLEYYYREPEIIKNSITNEHYDINVGGQKMMVSNQPTYLLLHNDFASYNKKLNNVADVTAYGFGPDEISPEYSYISGDITNAYTEKAVNADRSMMFMETGIEGAPAVFMVMDKVTSDTADMKKKFLLQCLAEPEISDNAITISRGTLASDNYTGEITSQILYPKNYTINAIGGIGKQWFVDGYNFIPDGFDDATGKGTTRLDFGWGRIEISSDEDNETEYFLNVMYVNDKGKFDSVQKAELIENGCFLGGKLLNKITLFNKYEEKINGETSVLIPGNTSEIYDIALTGFNEGDWQIFDDNGGLVEEINVSKESGVLYFSGTPGEYTIKKSNLPTPHFDVYYDNGNHIIDINKSSYDGLAYFDVSIGSYSVKSTDYKTIIPSSVFDENSEAEISICAVGNENILNSDLSSAKINTHFGGGEGTKEKPYKIYNENHFYNIEAYSDSYFILMDNIVLNENYTPFEFWGELNGNGRSITLNLSHVTTENVGMFSVLNAGAKIYDLRIYGSVSGYKYVGAVAGIAYGTIKDCTNYASVYAKYIHSGGIAGHAISNIQSIRGCINYGKIFSEGSYAGGIVSYNESPVILCANYGEIGADSAAGGIAGISYKDIYASFNKGLVKASSGSAGGIAGQIAGNYIYKDCFNTGDIYGSVINEASQSGVGLAGGIVGYKASAKNKLYRCYNTGNIYINKTLCDAAGIVGGYNTANGYFSVIEDCVYLSDIKSGESNGIIVLSEEEFLNKDNFNFDFENIWDMDTEGYMYPQLKHMRYSDLDYNPDDVSLPESLGEYKNNINLLSLSENLSYPIVDLLNEYVMLTFGKVNAGNEQFLLNDCGIVFSATDSTPEIGENNCIKYSYGRTSDAYGVLLYGSLDPQVFYYVRSYATYTYKGMKYTFYGDIRASKPNLVTF